MVNLKTGEYRRLDYARIRHLASLGHPMTMHQGKTAVQLPAEVFEEEALALGSLAKAVREQSQKLWKAAKKTMPKGHPHRAR